MCWQHNEDWCTTSATSSSERGRDWPLRGTGGAGDLSNAGQIRGSYRISAHQVNNCNQNIFSSFVFTSWEHIRVLFIFKVELDVSKWCAQIQVSFASTAYQRMRNWWEININSYMCALSSKLQILFPDDCSRFMLVLSQCGGEVNKYKI